MASSKEYLNFILEQLLSLDEITYRAMRGKFIIYYHGKIVDGIYDNLKKMSGLSCQASKAIKVIPSSTYCDLIRI